MTAIDAAPFSRLTVCLLVLHDVIRAVASGRLIASSTASRTDQRAYWTEWDRISCPALVVLDRP
jgi:hypothetical protein